MSPHPIAGVRFRGRRAGSARAAFSLVELLTVVGIIALLIGILLPAMAGARTEARRSATRQFLASCERGLEMFSTDFGQYPSSERRFDPVEYPGDTSSKAPFLSGAHSLARAMIGHDSNGVDYGARSLNDAGRSLKWDPPTSNHLLAGSIKLDKRRNTYVDKAAYKLDKDLNTKSTDEPVINRTVFIDNFDFPVLYYRANARGSVPFGETIAQANSTGARPVYMQEDNAEITGGKYTSGTSTATVANGWVFAGSDNKKHGMGQLGFNVSTNELTVKANPDRKGLTFAGMLHNANALKTGKTVKPVNDSSFLLITPGPDGLYGTQDDVTNLK